MTVTVQYLKKDEETKRSKQNEIKYTHFNLFFVGLRRVYVDGSSRHEYNAFFVESILNSNRDSYVVIEIAHALVSSRTSVHGQGHRDNKRVMMNDVLPSKKCARAHRAARAHVGSRYGPLTRFNDLENYYTTDKPIVIAKNICMSILHDFYLAC